MGISQMELPLDIVRTRGRAAKVMEIEVVGSLTAEDIASLSEHRGTTAPRIAALRERHHTLARMLASGRTCAEAAAICGYSISRVSILTGDPTFRDLIEFYREDVNRVYADVHEHLAGMTKDAILLMRDRMEEQPEKLSNGLVLDLIRTGSDRIGHGPQTKAEVNVNVGLADRLEAARKRMTERVIDVTPLKTDV